MNSACENENKARASAVYNALVASAIAQDISMEIGALDIVWLYVTPVTSPPTVIVECSTHKTVMAVMLRLGQDTGRKWERRFEYGRICYKNTYRKDVPITLRSTDTPPNCHKVKRKKIVPAVEAVPEHEEEEEVMVCGPLEETDDLQND